ncbi:2-hydroxyacyl-CoA dehydratase family protein [Fusibacter sp. JL216-2]|uniref:2-hydroxyacyl-CoA dehydratase family protein n=1 Tax=Fusibacter sp. JL216-2 TaxID=3071453 RepID=UPI003D3497D8
MQNKPLKKVGITTTVPAEILYAAGVVPVDMNNLFITAEKYDKYIERAERDGFPKSMCAWIKGIYGAVLDHEIDTLIGVIEGDCSNTKVLLEVLERKGVKMIPFGFPHGKDVEGMTSQIETLCKILGVTQEAVNFYREKLGNIRNLGVKLDELTYETNQVKGFENHLYLVSFSDFMNDPDEYAKLLEDKIYEAKTRQPMKDKIRLGYMGVPPMQGDLYDYLESMDARVVFNEVQREFMFPRWAASKNIVDQYLDYTYPYDLSSRLADINDQVELRKIDAIIHYTQAFCHKAAEDMIVKTELSVPVLQIEGDKLNCLDARTKLRIEAFVDMLKDKKEFELCAF